MLCGWEHFFIIIFFGVLWTIMGGGLESPWNWIVTFPIFGLVLLSIIFSNLVYC